MLVQMLQCSDIHYTHLCYDIFVVKHIFHFWVCLQELLNLGIRQNELSDKLRARGGEGALHKGAAQETMHHFWVHQESVLHLALELREEASPAVFKDKAVQTFYYRNKVESTEWQIISSLRSWVQSNSWSSNKEVWRNENHKLDLWK